MQSGLAYLHKVSHRRGFPSRSIPHYMRNSQLTAMKPLGGLGLILGGIDSGSQATQTVVAEPEDVVALTEHSILTSKPT